jgi:hypothetical protein
LPFRWTSARVRKCDGFYITIRSGGLGFYGPGTQDLVNPSSIFSSSPSTQRTCSIVTGSRTNGSQDHRRGYVSMDPDQGCSSVPVPLNSGLFLSFVPVRSHFCTRRFRFLFRYSPDPNSWIPGPKEPIAFSYSAPSLLRFVY